MLAIFTSQEQCDQFYAKFETFQPCAFAAENQTMNYVASFCLVASDAAVIECISNTINVDVCIGPNSAFFNSFYLGLIQSGRTAAVIEVGDKFDGETWDSDSELSQEWKFNWGDENCEIPADWEIVDAEIAKMSVDVENQTDKSYRDALLSKMAQAVAKKAEISNRAPVVRKAWKPALTVVKSPYKRVDKLYGPQPDVPQEEEDDGIFSLSCGFLDHKASVGVSRVRAINMLRPAALDRKNERIAEKAAQQAAAGVLSAGSDSDEDK